MPYLRKIKFIILLSVLALIFTGCTKYALTAKQTSNYPDFEQQKETVCVGIKIFEDKRPEEEKEGLTEKTKKILSFATKDTDFKEKIDSAITQRIKTKLEQKGMRTNTFPEYCQKQDYILEGEIQHFQAVMRLPNTTFVPYLGTAATIITKDEFNLAVSIKATLKNIKTDKILFSRVFDASDDLKLPTGILNLARFKRGLSYKFKALDETLESVLEEIAVKSRITIEKEIAAIAQ